MELKNSLGWGPKRIGEQLRISPSTVCNWTRGRFSPFGSCVVPRLDPSPSLSYLVGAFLGDGALIRSAAYHYELRLRVTDLDFALHFAACLRVTTGRPTRVRLDTRGFFVVRAWSKLLFEYLSSWKSDFETIDRYPAEFIQGFADAEGCPGVASSIGKPFSLNITLVNTEKRLLVYIGKLLETKFDIASHISMDRREHLMWGRVPCYYLRIGRRVDIERFVKCIGFSIKRKQEKLLTAFFLLQTYGPSAAGFEWRKMYSKRGRNWVRVLEPNSAFSARGNRSGSGAPGGI